MDILVSFLIVLLVVAVVWWIVHRIPLPSIVMTVAEILIVVGALIALVGLVTGHRIAFG